MEELKINLPKEIQKNKFVGLDGLRGLSILIVIVAHILRNYNVERSRNIGYLGVYIFFVISGFLITTLIFKEKIKYGKIDLKYFYIRRALRIVPVVFLYLIVLFFLNIIFGLNISKMSFISALLFFRNMLPYDWHTAHFWSLSIEEQYYLIFPFLISLISLCSYKRLIQILIIVIPLISLIYYKQWDYDVIHVNSFLHNLLAVIALVFGRGTVLILVGSLFSILFLTNSYLINIIQKKISPMISVLLLGISAVICLPMSHLYLPFINEAIFAVSVGILIIVILKENSFLAQILEFEYLKKIGVLSYSLYIWQQIFTYQQPWYNAGNNLFLIFLNLISLFAVALVCYWFYERKFLNYKEIFKKV